MIKDIVLKNRSYRGFDESYSFTREDLLEYVDAMRLCASSANIQPLKYYISYEKEEVESILTFTHFGGALPELHLPRTGNHPTAFIIICQDTDISSNIAQFQKDVGIVAQTALLMAAEKDLGGLMIGNFQGDDIKKLLKFADNIKPQLVIALGKPAEEIVITNIPDSGITKYYRDEKDVHYVPKRKLEDVVIN
ncbi:MAG: nitroreductase family protein [Butyrivibrio sp.]|nr:nitroreductase family protein [Butyrivibrio sp.]